MRQITYSCFHCYFFIQSVHTCFTILSLKTNEVCAAPSNQLYHMVFLHQGLHLRVYCQFKLIANTFSLSLYLWFLDHFALSNLLFFMFDFLSLKSHGAVAL
jgi:hypothetical protein